MLIKPPGFLDIVPFSYDDHQLRVISASKHFVSPTSMIRQEVGAAMKYLCPLLIVLNIVLHDRVGHRRSASLYIGPRIPFEFATAIPFRAYARDLTGFSDSDAMEGLQQDAAEAPFPGSRYQRN
jgi:hypothetical protein